MDHYSYIKNSSHVTITHLAYLKTYKYLFLWLLAKLVIKIRRKPFLKKLNETMIRLSVYALKKCHMLPLIYKINACYLFYNINTVLYVRHTHVQQHRHKITHISIKNYKLISIIIHNSLAIFWYFGLITSKRAMFVGKYFVARSIFTRTFLELYYS